MTRPRYASLAPLSCVIVAALLAGCAAVPEPGLPEPVSERPQLGLRLRVTPTSELAEGVLTAQAQVLTVVKVRDAQAAALAGLQDGDVLLAIDGVPVSGMRDAFAVMQTKRWGDAVDLTYFRDGEVQHVQAVMAKH